MVIETKTPAVDAAGAASKKTPVNSAGSAEIIRN
jgi:hypothetical protein